MQLSFPNCLLEVPELVFVEFFKTILCKGEAQKLYRTLPKIVKKIENAQYFQYLGHSEQSFDHKLGNFFEKCGSGLVSSSKAFRRFFQPKFSNLT